MNHTLAELSDFWQDVLWIRFNGDRVKAVQYLVNSVAMYPHSSEGRFAHDILKRMGTADIFGLPKKG